MHADGSSRRATLKTVAEVAGVSVPTVSKVVNGRSDVAPTTRARIQQLLLEFQYPARAANPAATPVTTLSMVFDAMRTPNNLQMILGATEAAALTGGEIVVGIVPDDARGPAWARSVAHAEHRGLILVTTRLSRDQHREFLRVGVPVVLIDPVNIPPHDVPSVGATNFNGGLEATDHLLSLGHRRIGCIQGPSDAVVSMARVHGYHAALSQAKIATDPTLVRDGEFTFDAGLRAGMDLLTQANRPTAVFASNDLQALGLIEAARCCNLRIPDDLSIVGFDDMAPARWASPPLTTVQQPFAEMGRTAVQNLMQLIAGEKLATPRVELATHIVVRQSTAPASARLGVA